MRVRPLLLAMASGVAANCRKPGIIVACTLALSSLGLSEPARAQCAGTVDKVVCTMSGNPYSSAVPGNPYQNLAPGINVGGGAGDLVNVTLEPGVQVLLPGSGITVQATNFAGGSVVLSANGATINVTQVPPSSGGNRGLHVETSSGDATITASGKIDVAGEGGATTQ
jgi:hypothetical protein